MEIVAHRGSHANAPENTMEAFYAAIEEGADAIEFDLRLSKDGELVVTHYLELARFTDGTGYLFDVTLAELAQLSVRDGKGAITGSRVATLEQVLGEFAGKVGLEIEIKGPEREAAVKAAESLRRFEYDWPSMEVTSFEPALLVEIGRKAPGLPVDLLFPRSEPWMTEEIVVHLATGRARLAGARGVHLHPSQLTAGSLDSIQDQGFEVHGWDVNDRDALALMSELGVARISTDRVAMAREHRTR